MYAIVKTGGKQYKVATGDVLEVEKLEGEPGTKIKLEAICIVDGKKVNADPAKAAKTNVEAVILDQFKGEKQIVFKFKKRKNYKRLRGHRQNLTRIQIESIGAKKTAAKKPAAAKATSAKAAAAEAAPAQDDQTASADAE